MGGLVKTTLAKLVYNDPRMDKEFKLKIWICDSDDFGIVGLVKAMLESIEGRGCDTQSLDGLQHRLREKISRSKFMLVLDDVWNENAAKWDDLKDVLINCRGIGSIVIVTTRIRKISTLMASANNIHYLERLSEDDSWSLFKQAIGLNMMEKYMEKIGGVMRTMKRKDEWRSILDSATWDSQDETCIFSTLRLSYDHLSPHFRKCYTYCSAFSKDFVMRKDDLIHLWMANGFISPSKQNHWYDIGQNIFNELVLRFFIQDISEDVSDGTSCKIHDLMHDLASKMTSSKCFSSET